MKKYFKYFMLLLVMVLIPAKVSMAEQSKCTCGYHDIDITTDEDGKRIVTISCEDDDTPGPTRNCLKGILQDGDSLIFGEGIFEIREGSSDSPIWKLDTLDMGEVESIYDNLGAYMTVRHLIVGKNIKRVECFRFVAACAERITVSDENELFEDGDRNCIIGKESKTLFVGCQNTVIPNDVKTISSEAFANSVIKEIIIPSSVTYVGDMVFMNCQSLQRIEFQGSDCDFGRETFTYAPESGIVIVPKGTAGNFSWKLGKAKMHMGEGGWTIYEKVGEQECGCGKHLIETVLLDDGYKAHIISGTGGIDTSCLEGFVAKNDSLIFGKGITKIDSALVESAVNIRSIDFGEVPDIKVFAMDYIEGVEKITVSSNNTVYEDLNSNCLIEKASKKLVIGCKNTVIPDSVKIIGYLAFSCINIKNVIIPSGVTEIQTSAFQLSGIENIVLPDSVEKLGASVFADCENLKSVKLSNNLQTISSHSFRGCTELTTITIPEKVTAIEDYAFHSCPKLTQIIILGTDLKIEDADSAINKYTKNGIIKVPESHYNEYKSMFEGLGFSFDNGFWSLYNLNPLVTFDTGGVGEAPAIQNTNPDGTVNEPEAPSATGYTFGGWYKDKEYKEPWSFSTDTVSEDITLYAYWIADTFKITLNYNANGGSQAPASQEVTVAYPNTKATFTLSKVKPTRTGYTFKGWYTEKTGGDKVGSKIKIGSEKILGDQSETIYAQWELAEYKITYVLDKGKNSTSNPKTYTYKSKTIKLASPTKKGYKFGGWFTSSKFKTKITEIKKGSTGDKTIYAKWTPIKYTVKFDKNGGSGTMKAQSMTYDTKVKLSKNSFKRTGYTFLGWSTNKKDKQVTYKNAQSVKNLTSKDKSTITLYAIWKKKK